MSNKEVGNQYRWSEKNPAAETGSGVSPTRRIAGMVSYITGRAVKIAESPTPVRGRGNPHRVEEYGVAVPEGAEATFADLRDLGTVSEALGASVKTSNGRLLRNIQANLPRGLTPEERVELTLRIVKKLADKGDGRVVVWAIHVDPEGKNPHAHIFVSSRPLKKTKGAWQWDPAHPERSFGQKYTKSYLVRNAEADERWITSAEWNEMKEHGWEKVFTYTDGTDKLRLTPSQAGSMDGEWERKSKNPVSRSVEHDDWDSKKGLFDRRKLWEKVENAYLDKLEEKNPSRSFPRVDCRSYKARGIDRIPMVHVGTGRDRREWAVAMNEQIRESNRILERIDRLLARLKELRDRLVAVIRYRENRRRQAWQRPQAQARRDPRKYAMILEDQRRAWAAGERAQRNAEVVEERPSQSNDRTPDLYESLRRLANECAEVMRQQTERKQRTAEERREQEQRDAAIEAERADAERRAKQATADADARGRAASKAATVEPTRNKNHGAEKPVRPIEREVTEIRREVEEQAERWDDFHDEWVDFDYADDFEPDWQPSYDEHDER